MNLVLKNKVINIIYLYCYIHPFTIELKLLFRSIRVLQILEIKINQYLSDVSIQTHINTKYA